MCPVGLTTYSPKVNPRATHTSGRRGFHRPLEDVFSLLGLRSRPQTELRTGFRVRQGLAESRSQKLSSGKEPREGREEVWAFGLGKQPAQLSGVSHLLRKQSRHRWAPAVIWESKILATRKTLWKNPNPYNPFFFKTLWLLALWSLQL